MIIFFTLFYVFILFENLSGCQIEWSYIYTFNNHAVKYCILKGIEMLLGRKKVLITLFCKYSMFKKKKKIGEKECIWNLEHFRNCIWKKDLFFSRLNFEFKFWNFVDLDQLGNLKWTYGLIYPFTMFILPLQSSGWLSELLFGCDFVRDRVCLHDFSCGMWSLIAHRKVWLVKQDERSTAGSLSPYTSPHNIVKFFLMPKCKSLFYF